ncbi:flavin monoamine oxidase family protein [Alteribacter aurantiacus]|uniref:flavin monoamine oxidase family protein n=1 Tax=Alteribacter aurantiacus TaxID=254410 RepID=UPI000424A2EE|nr:flavin monoamine oxidase family protein [Alteribacter aurantiacus]
MGSFRDVVTTSKEHLQILQDGLLQTINPKRVIIAGAGLAGLTAAYLLKNAGHDVVVLEGNTRVGGRVFTVREPFEEGNHWEVGAMRIPEHHHLVLALAEKFNLPLIPYISSSDNNLIYVNNRLVRQYEYDENPELVNFGLSEDEKGKTAAELLEEALRPFYTLYINSNEEERQRLKEQFEPYSMEAFLRDNPFGGSLSEEAVHMIKVLVGVVGFPEMSFIDTFEAIISTTFSDVSFFQIEGGNDLLAQALFHEVEEEVLFGERVIRIIQNDSSVQVITRRNDGVEKTFDGDLLITTIPFTAFQFIDVVPRHSIKPDKWRIIQTLPYVPANKVGLEFSEKFWEEDGMEGGSLVTDLPYQFIFYPSDAIGQPGGGVINATYSWGNNARLWVSLSEEERIQQALDFVASIHGEKVYETFIKGLTYNWDEHPYSAGCFTLYAPYQAASYPAVIKRPEGHIHFAGEHASDVHAWMEGAIDSGVRVALEINNGEEAG